MTAENPTDENIEALRRDAGVHGDIETVELCTLALNGEEEARSRCKEIIEDARAAADEITVDFHNGSREVFDTVEQAIVAIAKHIGCSVDDLDSWRDEANGCLGYHRVGEGEGDGYDDPRLYGI